MTTTPVLVAQAALREVGAFDLANRVVPAPRNPFTPTITGLPLTPAQRALVVQAFWLAHLALGHTQAVIIDGPGIHCPTCWSLAGGE